MKPIFAPLLVSLLMSGCAVFEVPDQTFDPPVVTRTATEKNQAWAADKVKQKREAERTRFEKDLKQTVSEDPS